MIQNGFNIELAITNRLDDRDLLFLCAFYTNVRSV